MQSGDDWYFQAPGGFQHDPCWPQGDQFDDQFTKGARFICTTELIVALVRGYLQESF